MSDQFNSHPRLNELGIKFGTDKADGLGHAYLPVYEFLFRNISRNMPYHMLEVGVQFGNSLRVWHEYFPNAILWGMDCADNGIKPLPDVHVLIGDAYSQELLIQVNQLTFELMIDDGPHTQASQQWFCAYYAPLLSSTGILIVEDVPTLDWIPGLKTALPKGFDSMTIDCRPQSPLPDSILFVAWRERS